MVFDFSTDQLNFSDVETFFTAKDLITNLATNLILIAKLIKNTVYKEPSKIKILRNKGTTINP